MLISYNEGTKIYDLYEKVKNIKSNDLLISDDYNPYETCVRIEKSIHLHNCVIRAKDYPFLNEYIDEYLNLYPNKINCKNRSGSTSLMTVRTKETLEILLKHGANVNEQNMFGWSAIMYFMYNKLESSMISMLIKHGADINIRNVFKNASVISIAIEYDFINIILPTRKKYFENIDKDIIIYIKYWKVRNIDYKILSSQKIKNMFDMFNYM